MRLVTRFKAPICGQFLSICQCKVVDSNPMVNFFVNKRFAIAGLKGISIALHTYACFKDAISILNVLKITNV